MWVKSNLVRGIVALRGIWPIGNDLQGCHFIRKGTSVFGQECPICWRPLQISSEHNGQMVTCHHCRGRFLADAEQIGPSLRLLERVDDLLAAAFRRLDDPASDVRSVINAPKARRATLV